MANGRGKGERGSWSSCKGGGEKKLRTNLIEKGTWSSLDREKKNEKDGATQIQQDKKKKKGRKIRGRGRGGSSLIPARGKKKKNPRSIKRKEKKGGTLFKPSANNPRRGPDAPVETSRRKEERKRRKKKR